MPTTTWRRKSARHVSSTSVLRKRIPVGTYRFSLLLLRTVIHQRSDLRLEHVNRAAFKDGILLLPIQIVGRRERKLLHPRKTFLWRCVPQLNEPLGLVKWKRPNKNSVNEAKDGSVR